MPSNPRSTPQARSLLRHLQGLATKSTLFGHQDALAYGVDWKNWHEFRTDVHDVCGRHPAVFGWDLGKIGPEPSNIDLVDFRDMRFWMREVYRRGGINTVSWHANNFLGGDAWATGTPTVAAILPGGSHHDALLEKLDLIADFFGKVNSGPPDFTPIPIIFRPYHEHTGDWFWWGKPHTSVDEFLALWQFTYEYFTEVKKLHQLLWCYSTDIVDSYGQYLEYYPGDNYVDILGLDDYHDLGRTGQTKNLTRRLKMLVEIAESKNKVPALTETGFEGIPKANWWTRNLLAGIQADPIAARIAWALVWRNADARHHYAPYPGHASEEDFRTFTANPAISLLDDLPELYGEALIV